MTTEKEIKMLQFNGLDDYISIDKIEIANDFTIEAWIYLAHDPADGFF